MTVINSNISALKAQSSLTKNARTLDTATERLSTGLRINSAKDDAAGLAITNRMTAQINGLNQAVRNANDGIAMIATIEGSLTQSTAVLQRMRELAVQSANGTNSTEDRQFLQAEMTQLNSELDRIASQARFNGMKVLDGTFTNREFQIGANGSETIAVSINSASSDKLGSYQLRSGSQDVVSDSAASTNLVSGADFSIFGNLGEATVGVSTGDDAREVTRLVNDVTSKTGVSASAVTKLKLSDLTDIGALSFKLVGKNESAVTVTANIQNVSDLTDIASNINTFSSSTGVIAQLASDKKSIMLSSNEGYDILINEFSTNGTSGSVSVTALKGDSLADVVNPKTTAAATVLTSGSVDSATVTGDILFSSNSSFTVVGVSAASASTDFVKSGPSSPDLIAVSSAMIGTPDKAQSAISTIDGAIATVSAMRANLGAIASRLEKTVDALTSSSVNTAAARSRILDTDYAQETSALAKSQIIAQASTAMLAQANQQPQQVLQLLKQ